MDCPHHKQPSLDASSSDDLVWRIHQHQRTHVLAGPASCQPWNHSDCLSQPKAFAKLNGLSHADIPNGGRNHETLAGYTTAWSQVFLAGDKTYSTYLDGEEAKKNMANTSIFAKATDYIYSN